MDPSRSPPKQQRQTKKRGALPRKQVSLNAALFGDEDDLASHELYSSDEDKANKNGVQSHRPNLAINAIINRTPKSMKQLPRRAQRGSMGGSFVVDAGFPKYPHLSLDLARTHHMHTHPVRVERKNGATRTGPHSVCGSATGRYPCLCVPAKTGDLER